MYIAIQGFTGVYIGVHNNTGVSRSINGCTYEYRGFRGVYMGVNSNTGVYRSIHG